MFTNATNKFWSLVMTGLADVDGFKICMQVCVCVWLGFQPLKLSYILVIQNKTEVRDLQHAQMYKK